MFFKKFTIYRHDHESSDYLLMQLTNSLKKSTNNNSNLNFEIQSTDYNHGLSASTSTVTYLKDESATSTDNKKTEESSNALPQQLMTGGAPPSLLSLKVNSTSSDFDYINVQHKNVSQNSKSTNLFPIAINDSNNKASK
jgi:hypothetical protein